MGMKRALNQVSLRTLNKYSIHGFTYLIHRILKSIKNIISTIFSKLD
jgi:hypothetical protein